MKLKKKFHLLSSSATQGRRSVVTSVGAVIVAVTLAAVCGAVKLASSHSHSNSSPAAAGTINPSPSTPPVSRNYETPTPSPTQSPASQKNEPSKTQSVNKSTSVTPPTPVSTPSAYLIYPSTVEKAGGGTATVLRLSNWVDISQPAEFKDADVDITWYVTPGVGHAEPGNYYEGWTVFLEYLQQHGPAGQVQIPVSVQDVHGNGYSTTVTVSWPVH